MKSRKLIFNIYENYLHGSKKEITPELLVKVCCELPIKGSVMFTLGDGSRLMVSKRDYVKNETYDVYWNIV